MDPDGSESESLDNDERDLEESPAWETRTGKAHFGPIVVNSIYRCTVVQIS